MEVYKLVFLGTLLFLLSASKTIAILTMCVISPWI